MDLAAGAALGYERTGQVLDRARLFGVYWSALRSCSRCSLTALWRRAPEMRLQPRLARLRRRFAGTAGLVLGVRVTISGLPAEPISLTHDIPNESAPAPSRDGRGLPITRECFTLPHAADASVISVESTSRSIRLHSPGRHERPFHDQKTGRESRLTDSPALGAVTWEVDHLAVEGAHIKQRFRPIQLCGSMPFRQGRCSPGDIRTIHVGSIWEQKGFKNSEI